MKIIDHDSARPTVTSSTATAAAIAALCVSAGEKAPRLSEPSTAATVVPDDIVNDWGPASRRFRSSIPSLRTDGLVSCLLIP